MRITKIDVKKTLIELPDNRPIYSEIERKGLPEAIALKEGEMPKMMSANEIRHDYEIRKVMQRDFTVAYYAVELDERGMFEILNEISNSKYDEWKRTAEKTAYSRGVLDGKGEGIASGIKVERARIHELPWFKRMLGKF